MPEENAIQKDEHPIDKQISISAEHKRPIDDFAEVAFWSAVLAWGIFALFLLIMFVCDFINISHEPMDSIIFVFLFIEFLLILVSVFSGVIGFFRILVGKERRSGIVRAVIGILSILVFLIFVIAPSFRKAPNRARFNRMRELGKSISAYRIDHNDTYPTADKWCDILAAYDPNIKTLLKSKCLYSINPKCEPASPNDVVLLFEIEKASWNRCGGPELLSFSKYRRRGMNVLFNDGHVKFVIPENFNNLKWKAEDVNSVK
ncbi:MAG: hypothetical protein ABSH16_04915 [Sedimentisphaerales bacterium]